MLIRLTFAAAFGVPGIWLCLQRPVCGQAAKPEQPELELTDTLTRYRINWKFSEKVPVGRFVNGDYYVVGPAMITEVSPPAANGKNGSVLNLPLDTGISPFDSRVPGGRGKGYQTIRTKLPIRIKPGDALLSSISVEPRSLPAWLRPSDKHHSPVGTVSVLTCLKEPVPPDAFRPSYCDRKQEIYLARRLQRKLLPELPRAGIPFELEQGNFTLEEFADHFERPWLEVCFFYFDAPAEYQVQYGREAGRAVGIATLLLCLDFKPEEKTRLLINFVQYGIDLWGIVRAGFPGWPAHGGHGTGRKLPIVFAGIMLGDEDMQSPTKTYPDIKFGEDMQTMYDKCWTGAKVVYAGHVGKGGLKGRPDWGAYEHLSPRQWPGDLGESYRRCCTSVAWVGQALAARLLNAEEAWDHDAFFDYVDRWMTEDDSQHIQEIKKERGRDYSVWWARQRQAWDPFVNKMWTRYRYKQRRK
jgi:hypothetical protein